jgi:RNA polymerase sigma factor (sigma-70 family)
VRDLSDFARHYAVELDGLVRLAFVVCGDRSMAEDAVSDAVVKVWGQWRRDRVVDLGAYLRRAVLNALTDQGRSQHRHRRRQALFVGPDVILPGDAVEDRDLLWDAVRSLPVDQRAVIAVRYLCDLSESETAKVLGVPIGTVKSRATRGIERLRVLVRR